MCIRFVYRGDDIITGFNFDIDPAVWDHQIITAPDRFYLGILPDGLRHGYHGVHQNGNTGTLLYVHGNPSGRYQTGSDALTISDLTEQFIQAQISWEEALSIVQTKKIVYAPDATMQAVLSDRYGRTAHRAWNRQPGRYRNLFPDGQCLSTIPGEYPSLAPTGRQPI